MPDGLQRGYFVRMSKNLVEPTWWWRDVGKALEGLAGCCRLSGWVSTSRTYKKNEAWTAHNFLMVHINIGFTDGTRGETSLKVLIYHLSLFITGPRPKRAGLWVFVWASIQSRTTTRTSGYQHIFTPQKSLPLNVKDTMIGRAFTTSVVPIIDNDLILLLFGPRHCSVFSN